MYSPFPTEIAYHYCLILKRRLQEGFLKLEQVTRLSAERAGQGVMLGTLVCSDSENNRIVLCASSGISKKMILSSDKNQTEWISGGEKFILVPPVVSAEEIDKALKKNDGEIHRLTDLINSSDKDSVSELKEKRKKLCDESLEEVRKLYGFNTVFKSSYSLAGTQLPTGTGDCCEPKLFHYALSQGLKPVSLAQIFYEEAGSGNSRREGCGEDGQSRLSPGERLLPLKTEYVPPCDERCGFLLPKMLGLEVLYCDRFIVVVNKPSGLLSVPGRGEEKQDCVVKRVKALYGDLCLIEQPSVHRLDMETSGILVLAFTEEAHRNLSAQFEKGTVHKEYVALLEGVLEKQAVGELAPKRGEKEGCIKLKFRLDPENRPHQIYDEVYGKEGITKWKNEGLVWYEAPDNTKTKATKIRFFPETGRTHQLRLASADKHGLGLPIIGDSLYGHCSEGQRLMLHAEKITFRHPINDRLMTFEKKGDF
ncbi:MAG: RluA family pseudouridine synthase [Treponema sp.]|nr:RluA family pseudouridine synthase [Treponema sp.]